MKRSKANSITHTDLVEAGRKWMASRAPVVVTEVSACSEEPDVLGLGACFSVRVCGRYTPQAGSVLIECKASRADFRRDADKPFRRCPELGIGRLRYYLTPPSLIDPDELPESWGLLETQGKRIRVVRAATAFGEWNHQDEMLIAVSVFRRLEIREGEHCSIRAYVYETKNTATLTVAREDK